MKTDVDLMLHCRDDLRQARDLALGDAEGFQEILFALERTGCALSAKAGALGGYESKMRTLAEKSALAKQIPTAHPIWHMKFDVLYCMLTQARNDAMHQGANARHITQYAITLSLILEDALVSQLTTVADFMVRDPICAHAHQPMSYVRQQMLSYSFSYLPIFCADKQEWHLISDQTVAEFLRAGCGNRNERLGMDVKKAASEGLNLGPPAKEENGKTAVGAILSQFDGRPVLIPHPNDRALLLGIITAYDLL